MSKISKQSSTINQYISSQPKNVRVGLKQLRQIIKKAAPEAEEVISYQMPAFRLKRIIVWFAGYKNHYGLYPYSKTIQVFQSKLKAYETSKGTIKFPLDKPLPVKLISDIVKYNIKATLEKEVLRSSVKKK